MRGAQSDRRRMRCANPRGEPQLTNRVQNRRPPQFVLYGGSFNPVHVGHVAFVRALLEAFADAQVLVIPTRVSPFKRDVPQLPAELRMQMLRRALAGLSRVSIQDLELHMPAPSFTMHTIVRLGFKYPTARLVWAMGSDAYEKFPDWYHARALLERTDLLIVSRAGHARDPAARGRQLVAGLPADWRARLLIEGDRAIDPSSGRTVVRLLVVALPEVASSDILQCGQAADVPPGARELLLDYWRKRDAG